MSFSRKPTCEFCEHEQSGKCEKKSCSVKISKHRKCKFFTEDKAKMCTEKMRKKLSIDRRIAEKRPLIVWEQSPSFYRAIWDEHYIRTVPRKIREASLITEEKQKEAEQLLNMPRYLPRAENVTYET